MEKIGLSELSKKSLLFISLLFMVLSLIISIFWGIVLYQSLLDEYESKGIAISQSIANTSVEILLNRDESTVQSIIDQFGSISGVDYVYVKNNDNQIISHTFVPTVPPSILTTTMAIETDRSDSTVHYLTLPHRGAIIDIATPILAGVAGVVHVGMNRSLIQRQCFLTILKLMSLILGVMIVSLFILYHAVQKVSYRLVKLKEYAYLLSKHDFQTKLDVDFKSLEPSSNKQDELYALTQAFIHLESTLMTSIDNIRKTASELKVGQSIQMAMLPPVSPNTPKETRFALQGFIEPARDVGGDFFDYTLQDNKLHLIIGDVSDKGVPAALFMAITISLLRSAATTLSDPGLILAHVNKGLCQYNDEALFVTVFYGILDLESGELIYSLGGHPAPFVSSRNDDVTPLPLTSGLALGIESSFIYQNQQRTLKRGDTLFCFTDGVTEAMTPSDTLFGEESLKHSLHQSPLLTPSFLIAILRAQLDDFTQGYPLSDDTTMLCLTYAPSDSPQVHTFQLPAELEALTSLHDHVEAFGTLHKLSQKESHDLLLSLEELITNTITHRPSNSPLSYIQLTLGCTTEHLIAQVQDNGQAFNPLDQVAPTPHDHVDKVPIGGLGIHLVRSLMTRIYYSYDHNMNSLILYKQRE